MIKIEERSLFKIKENIEMYKKTGGKHEKEI
jgi:hypothetical protein